MACPVCSLHKTSGFLCQVDRYAVYKCQKCAAEYVYPVPDSAALKAYYDREAWFEGGEKGGYANYDAQTAGSAQLIETVLDDFQGRRDLSILDIGCGYGSHLAIAAAKGWKCFGIEVSDHARNVAQSRLGSAAHVVADVADLVPHEFDLVLMLDVIEHLPSPYPLLFSLFSMGAITPKTRIVITTPNAGSSDALKDPAGWIYRHPPSHLVYYSAESLSYLLRRLQFHDIRVQGIHPTADGSRNLSPEAFAGLMVSAVGSNFTEFMRERYVPGTWSKIAEYEHLPRYALAQAMATGKQVLDFGCGTGYGAALLAKVARHVTGLDIDGTAQQWARTSHPLPNLHFHHCDDLGAGLAPGSFDVVTCFEMIEHVDHATQRATIAAIARLLRDDGVLVISTPNPEVTQQYGANPYHLREMSEPEFLALIHEQFPYVTLMRQKVRVSVTFENQAENSTAYAVSASPSTEETNNKVKELAYIAVCSKNHLKDLNPIISLDDEEDFIFTHLKNEKKLNQLKYDVYQLKEQVHAFEAIDKSKSENIQHQKDGFLKTINSLNEDNNSLNKTIHSLSESNKFLNKQINSLNQKMDLFAGEKTMLQDAIGTLQNDVRTGVGQAHQLTLEVRARDESITALKNSLSWRLTKPLRGLATFLMKNKPTLNLLQAGNQGNPYVVKQPASLEEVRPQIIHVIANFCMGGSSRLVVDLVENLGDHYQQSVLTSYTPSPPDYTGLDIDIFHAEMNVNDFISFFHRKKPDFIHVHYWGDCDENWYAHAFKAAEQLNIPVVENINTPVSPYISSCVKKYIYVSDYVSEKFGLPESNNITIYPGSDFSHFKYLEGMPDPENCIGMVYRLERDKLNEDSLLPLILALQRRPDAHALIVGGGSLLPVFKQAVVQAGVADRFEFCDYVAYAALPEYYRRLAVFVAPVWKESFGQVSPFAMNMKVPVCGYNIGALGEILGARELLAPPGDASALCDIIVNLLDKPALRKSIGEAMHVRAQAHFAVQSMIHAYGKVYLDVCSQIATAP